MFTQFVKRSVAPALLMVLGAAVGGIGMLLVVVGGIWEAFALAKLLDSKASDAGPKLPPL